MMKRSFLFPMLVCALFSLHFTPVQAELVWKKGDGVGTNQYIWHSSWSNPGPLPAGTDTYLQVHLKEAEQHIIFTMIGSTWSSTYDTPTEMVIEAASLLGI